MGKRVELDQKRKHMHPSEKASLLSRLFFCWIIPTFIKGYKSDLNEEDLHEPLRDHDSSILGDKMEEGWLLEIKSKSKPSMTRVTWNIFKHEIFFNGILLFLIELVGKLAQPLCIRKLMQFYVPNQTMVSKNEAWMCIAIIIIAAFSNVLLGHHYMLRNQHLGMRMRVACCSLIYRKSLKLSKVALINTTVGQVINLLSNDVTRFDAIFMHLHNIWTAPLQIIVVVVFLYSMLGSYALAGIALFTVFVPLQMFLGKKSSEYRRRVAIKTDERVRLMNEIICGIQVIKMYTWENPFAKLVEQARKAEVQQIRAASFIRAINTSFAMFLNRVALFLSILAYIVSGHTPTASYVFVVTSFFGIIRQAMVVHLPHVITALAEASVSIKRIEDFLLREEVVAKEKERDFKNDITSMNKKSSVIFLQEISAKWDPSIDENTLMDLNFEVESNELVAVIGPVGSGKTSLLHIILNELPATKGTVDVNGIISYASQEPWIFPGTIKENILFGQHMDIEKYKKVCQVCELKTDFFSLPYGDETVVGERGVMLSGGQKARVNLARAVYKDADIYLLDDPLSAVDTRVGIQLFRNCIVQYLKNKCVILVTHQLQYLRMVDRIYVLKCGTVDISGTFNELYELGSDDFKSVLKQIKESISGGAYNPDTVNETKNEERELKEFKQIGAIETIVYSRYIQAGGGYFMSFLVLFLFLITQFSVSFIDYFLNYWVNLEENKQLDIGSDSAVMEKHIFFKTENCIYFYIFIICFIVVVTIMRSVVFMNFCMFASKNLHNKMFSTIVNTNMRFFNVNPSGRILNRFSKDMGAIDEILPLVILDTIQIFLSVIFITILVGIVNPWNLIPSGIIFVIFYFLKLLFIASSRSIKRMEAITRSPVFSQMSTSMQGLTTIRAFGVQENLKNVFDRHQNLHSSASYMFLYSNRAFGFWLDLHCVIYTGLVAVGLLLKTSETSGANVGLAITQALLLTGSFQWGMRQWSEWENQMTSVERVTEYADLKPEFDNQRHIVSEDWPESGGIQFENVSLKYSSEEPFVLNNVNFSVNPTEKIGIVGRTGAGKSSLIVALFRLAEITGNIIIDEVDTKTISLKVARSKLSIIPQEPVLFSGTVRRNLDPFNQYEDHQLCSALKEVELERLTCELSAGLNSKVSEGGSNFSVGQRQLLCLARAIIRNNKILVLDEATANVDLETDELIQRTIREKFRHCTVLTIAHRLNTVMDSDKILVMDGGTVIEFDHPHILLQNSNSFFYKLVSETGNTMSRVLKKLAEETYKTRVKDLSDDF